MEDPRPPRIREAVRLGQEIYELEQILTGLLEELKAQQEHVNLIQRRLNLLWLEVGKLKHESGEKF